MENTSVFPPSSQIIRTPKPADFVPEPDWWPEHPWYESRRYRCQAWSSREGRQCTKQSMRHKNVCQSHGGASPSGIAHYRFGEGKFSQDLPPRLLDRYERSRADPDILTHTDEIALLDARVADLLAIVDSVEAGKTWEQLEFTYYDARNAAKRGDSEAVTQYMNALGKLIDEGNRQWSAWDSLLKTMDQRRKLTESERRRILAAKNVMTIQQAMAMFAAIATVVRKETDRLHAHLDFDKTGFLNAIQRGFDELMRRDIPEQATARRDDLENTAESL